MTEAELRDQQATRDMVIQTQPILWAQGMLEEAGKCRMEDARDAILTRTGMTLMSRFGVLPDEHNMRSANAIWVTDE